MNSTDTTVGGYMGSEMVTGTITNTSVVTTSLPKLLDEVIKPTFSGHVIKYRNLLVNSVDENKQSAGFTTWGGVSNQWNWNDRELDLMSEANVYGTTVFSSSGFDTGIDNRQYAIFQLKPEYIHSYGSNYFTYWLKNVANKTAFVAMAHSGHSNYGVAGDKIGIRPRFLIG